MKDAGCNIEGEISFEEANSRLWQKNQKHKFISEGLFSRVSLSYNNVPPNDRLEDWINGLPGKILGYKTPEERFDLELDLIYAQ